MPLNEFCANEKHVAKATQKVYVSIETIGDRMKLEIPLCNSCFLKVKNESFKGTTISI